MFSPKTLYITGEIDFKLFVTRPWFQKRNTHIRYPTIHDTKPAENWEVDYEQDYKSMWTLLPDDQHKEATKSYMELRTNGQTRVVLIKVNYHWLTGYSNFEVIESKITPIVKNYRLK